ncbi:MAG: hypothetical protein AB1489_36175 [Acidobacteriota bacterium]
MSKQIGNLLLQHFGISCLKIFKTFQRASLRDCNETAASEGMNFALELFKPLGTTEQTGTPALRRFQLI